MNFKHRMRLYLALVKAGLFEDTTINWHKFKEAYAKEVL